MARTASANRTPVNPRRVRGIGAQYTSGNSPNGQTYIQLFNTYFLTNDLVQATYSARSNLTSITNAQCTIIFGTPSTAAQIALAISDSLPGGLKTNGCSFITWSDETTTSASQLLNGYTQELGPSTIITDNPLTSGATTINVNNNTNFAGFSTTFYAELDDSTNVECVAVTARGGTGNKQWTVTRAQGGTTAHQFAQGTTIRGVAILSGAMTSSQTTITLNTNVAFTPASNGSPVRFSLMVDSEIVYTTEANAGTLPGPLTIARGTNNTSAAAHNDQQMVRLVWPDPGIIAFTAQAHASNLAVAFSPLGLQLRQLVVANPQLASVPDIILFETQRLQNDSNYIAEITEDCLHIRNASGGKPIIFQMNAYDAIDGASRQYTINDLMAQQAAVVNAVNPEWVTMELDGGSKQTFEDWVKRNRA